MQEDLINERRTLWKKRSSKSHLYTWRTAPNGQKLELCTPARQQLITFPNRPAWAAPSSTPAAAPKQCSLQDSSSKLLTAALLFSPSTKQQLPMLSKLQQQHARPKLPFQSSSSQKRSSSPRGEHPAQQEVHVQQLLSMASSTRIPSTQKWPTASMNEKEDQLLALLREDL
jgi:hypothetical protein